MVDLTDHDIAIRMAKNVAHVVTLNEDGSAHPVLYRIRPDAIARE